MIYCSNFFWGSVMLRVEIVEKKKHHRFPKRLLSNAVPSARFCPVDIETAAQLKRPQQAMSDDSTVSDASSASIISFRSFDENKASTVHPSDCAILHYV
jgi:hypothetical protein